MSQPEEKENEERRVMHIFNQKKHGLIVTLRSGDTIRGGAGLPVRSMRPANL